MKVTEREVKVKMREVKRRKCSVRAGCTESRRVLRIEHSRRSGGCSSGCSGCGATSRDNS